QFCTPAAAHEKGGVEGEIGYFRRNHWVPVPSASNLDELNAMLLACCRANEQRRRIDGRELFVGDALAIEREHLLPLPAARFDLAEVSFPQVNSSGCITVRANAYSVPLRPGTPVSSADITPWDRAKPDGSGQPACGASRGLARRHPGRAPRALP